MSNEQHLKCQTCFVKFPTNDTLTEHIEKYRSEERLLVAKLERCRLHLAQSYDINSDDDDDDDDDDRDEEDDDHESARPGQLQCPSRECKRVKAFSLRGNLLRHFQKHIQCYEICPFCLEIFKQLHRFLRHTCKDRSDKAKNEYMLRRVTHLKITASKELDKLQERAQKMAKTTQISVSPANTYLQPHHVACSIVTDDELTFASGAIRVATTNYTDGTFAKAATMRPSNNAELMLSSETTIGMPANDGGWASTASIVSTNDSGWAFAEMAPVANDSGWAFAETAPVANDSGWAFATTSAMPANGSGWAFAETVPSQWVGNYQDCEVIPHAAHGHG